MLPAIIIVLYHKVYRYEYIFYIYIIFFVPKIPCRKMITFVSNRTKSIIVNSLNFWDRIFVPICRNLGNLKNTNLGYHRSDHRSDHRRSNVGEDLPLFQICVCSDSSAKEHPQMTRCKFVTFLTPPCPYLFYCKHW